MATTPHHLGGEGSFYGLGVEVGVSVGVTVTSSACAGVGVDVGGPGSSITSLVGVGLRGVEGIGGTLGMGGIPPKSSNVPTVTTHLFLSPEVACAYPMTIMSGLKRISLFFGESTQMASGSLPFPPATSS